MSRRPIALLLVAAAEMGQAGLPQQWQPQPLFGDPRIQSVIYSPERVVPLRAALGYAVVVELSDEEHVENVVVGNSGGWQVTANKRGDHLIVKPAEGAATTNLVVTTDLRRYVFLLQLAGAGEPSPFVLHFAYPEPVASVALPVATPAGTYKLAGDRSLYPSAIADDGQRTTVAWPESTPLPAIYAVDANGREALVNGRMVGGSYVIQGTAPRFVFRRGKVQATATRRVGGR